jgi:hypothetical protein
MLNLTPVKTRVGYTVGEVRHTVHFRLWLKRGILTE